MTTSKKELESELLRIGKKLDILIRDFAGIVKKIRIVQKNAHSKNDIKKIADLKNKIATL